MAATKQEQAAPGSVKVFGTTMPEGWYAALMAGLGAAAFGVAVWTAARLSNLARTQLLYHGIVFGTFFGLYMVMPGGFEKHFNMPAAKKMTVADVMYYTSVVHSTAGFGDIYPTSFWARAVVATHLGLVFLATASMISFGS